MRRIAATLLLMLVPGLPLAADDGLRERIDLYGDFRFRLEQDWDSVNASGVERDDRARARIRIRFGLNLSLSERLTVGARLRSGSDLSQQSAHITILDFDDNGTGDSDFNLDKWFLRAKTEDGRLSGWVGRNGMPFWKQNELFWDDDVTPAGLAGSFSQSVGDGRLSVHGGWFSLPAGMRAFSGELRALQAVYRAPVGKVRFTAAGGWFAVDGDADDPDAALLLGGDGARDYRILVGNLQLRLSAGGRPLTFGTDLFDNREDDADGYVLSTYYGATAEPGDWQLGHTYARIEALAVIASYAQDDWVRWGNGPQTRGSNFRGHELRFSYAATRNLQVVARLYLVEALTTVEDGKRFRIDLNYKL
jgi:hypothetical protein